MLSAVCFRPVSVGSMACGSHTAVLLAALDDRAADPAVARVELAGARLVGVIGVAAVAMFVEGAFEHVVCSFESSELGAAVLELHTELPNSCSCG